MYGVKNFLRNICIVSFSLALQDFIDFIYLLYVPPVCRKYFKSNTYLRDYIVRLHKYFGAVYNHYNL